MPIGYCDEDEEGEGQKSYVPAWSKPKDDLDRLALGACRREKFATSGERKTWRKLRGYTLGADEPSILFDEWIKHCIKAASAMNKKRLILIFPNLCKWIDNKEKREDWIAQNREKILKERGERILEGIQVYR